MVGDLYQPPRTLPDLEMKSSLAQKPSFIIFRDPGKTKYDNFVLNLRGEPDFYLLRRVAQNRAMSLRYTPGGSLLSFEPIHTRLEEPERYEDRELPMEVAIASENVNTAHHLEQVVQQAEQVLAKLPVIPVRYVQPLGQVPAAAEKLVAATVEADMHVASTPAI
ncbi:hypothetical protein K469DRAFT_743739 [Zopfia rhizophila CBS 207.26]|uniref:Uncharacterized protein n=1 Tax=Zopfia rhizophila CBS 207.26 TaxID=1314779 RepID=A0A6A6EWB6_9PEZI|nr:hypothetical protein K469DRAFT_743739 [Zopfia rhizophila CBS 207.26]